MYWINVTNASNATNVAKAIKEGGKCRIGRQKMLERLKGLTDLT
jgi:hypothetical protein